jgi:hypothetical protein
MVLLKDVSFQGQCPAHGFGCPNLFRSSPGTTATCLNKVIRYPVYFQNYLILCSL